ncbi:chitinase KNAG_0F03090 [Huiozyma naganishii CBS 8797]|uniref:chitinase n=1 Tax=Huiozyma naganishii (strain ATCC MYA-139 / BCRC 22969 / CBS 8797 / KCTC 17520 / NBRC 10181 / NCYC 3082 / Yp74L-3) TaxID=1071383 RepID=J7S8M3_HUIN7|nr:hypothetical protein KNAG_0F03090 [Kazachstania naganishii CBS 8797]CCK70971.1 hypothetical protein KNAG_0F03090 [Kazachstania naganishii CBS 8797]
MSLVLNIFIVYFVYFLQTVLSFDINDRKNVAVYWGQNSAGTQQSLGNYCQSSDADIFILSFLDNFPSMDLNFADACLDRFPDGDHAGLLHCSQIASDIQTCQSLGKVVLLSMGGANGAYGFASSTQQEIEVFAENLWNTFGEGTGVTDRPFDSASVDGFDFDIENNNSAGYTILINKLRQLFTSGSKQYFISGSPQCPYPDASTGDMLANANVDFAFIQFYNNYCNVEKQFNWDTWLNFASTVSPNADIKLYLGLPGSPTAAGSGYISDMAALAKAIENTAQSKNFGGVSLWDASQAFSNEIDGTSYVHVIKSLLEKTMGSTATTSAATTAERTTSTLAPTIIRSSTMTSAGMPLSETAETTVTGHTHATTARVPITLRPFTTSQEDLSTVGTTTPSTIRRVTTTLTPTISNENKDVATETTTTTSAATTTSSPTTTTQQEVTHGAVTTLLPSTTIATQTPVTTFTNPAPAVTTAATATTAATTVTTPTDTPTSSAHEFARQLNALYAQGQFDGSATTCTDGAISCSVDGSIALCNFGAWVTMECAAGTTCFAFDEGDEVFTQCNFIDLKSTFL